MNSFSQNTASHDGELVFGAYDKNWFDGELTTHKVVSENYWALRANKLTFYFCSF